MLFRSFKICPYVYDRKVKDFVIPSTIEGVSLYSKLIVIVEMKLYLQYYHHTHLEI